MLDCKDMDLLQLEPYIRGKEFLSDGSTLKPRVIISPEQVEDFLTRIEMYDTAKSLYSECEKAADFYSTYPDFSEWFAKDIRAEVFYAAKNGGIYRMIPSYAVYMLRKAYEKANGMPNLIPLILPISTLSTFLTEGYFGGGLSLYDVICNVCCKDYTPLSAAKLKVEHSDFYEVYISTTKMVAAMPKDLAELLTPEVIRSIKVDGRGLVIDDVPVRTLSNYMGAVNSVYDLRELI